MDVSSITRIAGLIGEPGRIQMLTALLDGNGHSASELATAAAASPQTASSHLSKLLSGGLVVFERCGRQRLFRLKNADVAVAIEALGALAQHSGTSAVPEMRFARTCYDHLAGVLAIALRNKLLRRGAIRHRKDTFVVTHTGKHLLHTSTSIPTHCTRRGVPLHTSVWIGQSATTTLEAQSALPCFPALLRGSGWLGCATPEPSA